jgi:hypothetical protein
MSSALIRPTNNPRKAPLTQTARATTLLPHEGQRAQGRERREADAIQRVRRSEGDLFGVNRGASRRKRRV